MSRSLMITRAASDLACQVTTTPQDERRALLEGHAFSVLGSQVGLGVLPLIAGAEFAIYRGRAVLLARTVRVGDVAAVAAWALAYDAPVRIDVPDDRDLAFRRTVSTEVRLCRHVRLQLFTVRRLGGPGADPVVDDALEHVVPAVDDEEAPRWT